MIELVKKNMYAKNLIVLVLCYLNIKKKKRIMFDLIIMY